MKKIILFLVLALGLLPMLTKQGLTLSAFKMISQEVDMGLESVVCVSNPWITNSVIEGDYTIDTVCDLVPTANNDDCVEECHESPTYNPPSTGNGDDGIQNPYPTGGAGGSNGGNTGGTSNTTNTTTTTTNCKKRTGYLHEANFTNQTPVLGNNITITDDNFRNDSWGIINETNCGNGKIPKGSTVKVLSTTPVTRTGTTLEYYKVEYDDCEKGNNTDMPNYDANKPCSDCFKGNPLTNMTKILPTPKGKIDSGLYGYARGRLHDGIDFGMPPRQPIYAMFDGTVGLVVSTQKEGDKWRDKNNWTSKDKNAAGNRIYISSSVGGKNVKIGYWHLSTISANSDTNLIFKPGDKVKQGELIGYTGTTGSASSPDSSGPHLHLNAKENGVSIDPKKYLKAEINITNGDITTPCD